MTTHDQLVVRLELTSTLDAVEMVDTVSDYVARAFGLGEDDCQMVCLALRESVINAIKHGNQNDDSKRVFIDFEIVSTKTSRELNLCVRDQGEGFDPGGLPDPLDPANLLKTSGRGILMMHQFMDDVFMRRVPEGGMEIRMCKRLALGIAQSLSGD
jgi:serine/threonine-protein kinase RsbW